MNDTDFRDGFLFVGGQLALDFLNTRPVLNGQEATELLPDTAAFVRWCRAAELINARQERELLTQVSGERGNSLMRLIWDLREELRDAVAAIERSGAATGKFIRRVNDLLRVYPMLRSIKIGDGERRLESWFDASECENLLAPLAASIAALVTDIPASRLRQCERCILHFHDTSKNGTRRWCSMRLCGNRAKVAAYSSRRRRQEEKPRS